MRNTKKKQTYDNIIDNSVEILQLLEQIKVRYNFTSYNDLPYSFEYMRYAFDEIIQDKIQVGDFEVTGLDLLHKFRKWLIEDNDFPASLAILDKTEAMIYFPKIKEIINSRDDDFIYFYLRSYNPNAHRNIYEIIAHMIDASTDNQMQIIHNESRREALFGVKDLGVISEGTTIYYRQRRWMYCVTVFLEVLGRTYKWYD